jgi:hypothetical protein
MTALAEAGHPAGDVVMAGAPSHHDDAYLRAHLDALDKEIGQALGRSAQSVKWRRQQFLRGPNLAISGFRTQDDIHERLLCVFDAARRRHCLGAFDPSRRKITRPV